MMPLFRFFSILVLWDRRRKQCCGFLFDDGILPNNNNQLKRFNHSKICMKRITVGLLNGSNRKRDCFRFIWRECSPNKASSSSFLAGSAFLPTSSGPPQIFKKPLFAKQTGVRYSCVRSLFYARGTSANGRWRSRGPEKGALYLNTVRWFCK